MTIPTELLTRHASLEVARTWPQPEPGDALSPDALVLWDSLMEQLPKRKKKLPDLFPPITTETPEQSVLPVVHRWILWNLFSAMFEQNYADHTVWLACKTWETDSEAKELLLSKYGTPWGYLKPCLNREPRNDPKMPYMQESPRFYSYAYRVNTFYDDIRTCWDRAHIGARPGRELNPPETLADFMLRVRLYKRLGRVLPDRVPELPPCLSYPLVGK